MLWISCIDGTQTFATGPSRCLKIAFTNKRLETPVGPGRVVRTVTTKRHTIFSFTKKRYYFLYFFLLICSKSACQKRLNRTDNRNTTNSEIEQINNKKEKKRNKYDAINYNGTPFKKRKEGLTTDSTKRLLGGWIIKWPW